MTALSSLYTRQMIERLGHQDHPKKTIVSLNAGLWHFSFTHTPIYAPDTRPIQLDALIEITTSASTICLYPTQDHKVTDHIEDSLIEYADKTNLPYLNYAQPWPLEVIRVDKPWGAEVWYTGIEQRGICTASGIPLPWLLDCFAEDQVGSASNTSPLLLKILDPLPNPELGDLYFELHDQKIEVYVVTYVDPHVWPNGVGKIRYGFNQQVRNTYPSDEQFKTSYLSAVQAYEQCRNEIDKLLESNRSKRQIEADAPISPELMTTWLDRVPTDLKEQEQHLRQKMEGFTHFRDIKVGDVIKVEPYFPHSLQHGVRVIEFQTPSYERYILSFGQKVLTQSHWDTEVALNQAILSMPPESDFVEEAAEPGVKIEIIADFSAFTARRITLDANTRYELPASCDYSLLICANGKLQLSEDDLSQEDARLIPVSANSTARTCTSICPCVFIVATPKS